MPGGQTKKARLTSGRESDKIFQAVPRDAGRFGRLLGSIDIGRGEFILLAGVAMKWSIACSIVSILMFAPLASAQTTQPATATPPAEQMMNQMLESGGGAKALPSATKGPMVDGTSGRDAVAPGAPTMNVMREGTFIVKRVGRLTRSSDGQQMEFTFDSDRKAMKDPPVVILPNLKLMQMENAIA